MLEVDVKCRGCGETHVEKCDASGIAPGIPMQCPGCGRSEPHDPDGSLERVDDATEVERAATELDENRQAAQSAAYGGQEWPLPLTGTRPRVLFCFSFAVGVWLASLSPQPVVRVR